MWCSTCQHEVSAAALGEPEAAHCPACGNSIAGHTTIEPIARLPVAAPRLPDEDWQLEADVRSLERMLAGLRQARVNVASAIGPAHWPAVDSRLAAVGGVEPAAANPPKSTLAAWAVLSIGVSVLACGGVLLALSIAHEREDLWSLGLPLALAGQAALILGLVLQLDGLWQTSRQNARSLLMLDDELSRLRRPTRSAPAGRSHRRLGIEAFYGTTDLSSRTDS